MKIIVAAIEYHSPNLINKFINEWLKCSHVVKIYIASTSNNRSSKKPLLSKVINNVEIYDLDLANNGYGSAMNELLYLIQVDNQTDGYFFDYLLIGNIDVFPINISEPHFINDQFKVPMINVIENNKNRNPFISKFQKRFIFLYKIPLKLNSISLLFFVILIFKLIKIIKSNPWAVHGSFFCFNNKMVMSDLKFFNDSFLYCEELFYARNLEKLKIKLVESPFTVRHIGGVSTNLVINKSRKIFFSYWKESMNEFFSTL